MIPVSEQFPPVMRTAHLGAARIIAVWKTVEYAGLVLFTIAVPRIMAPEQYGRFAAVLSLVSLLVAASGLGSVVTFGRYMPEYQARGQWHEARALFTQLFWTRALLAGVMAGALALSFPSLVPGVSPLVRLAGAGALLAGATATTCYQAFLGLNALAKWSVQDALTRIVLLAFIIVTGSATTVGTAITSLFVTQLGFLGVGLLWTRRYFLWSRALLDRRQLASHLSFGGLFFLANLLLTAVWRGGDALVLVLSGQPTEAAFFSLANAAMMTVGLLFIQVAFMLVPTLTTLELSGHHARMKAAVAQLLKLLTIAAFLVILAVLAIGKQLIDVVLGTPYLPVADSLRILAFGLPALAVLGAGNCYALVHKQPGKALRVNGVALMVFVGASIALIPPAGAQGAALSVTMAFAGAGVAAAWEFSLAAVLVEARFGRLVAIGALALACLGTPGVPAWAIAGLAVMVFLTLLFWYRIVTPAEIREVLRGEQEST